MDASGTVLLKHRLIIEAWISNGPKSCSISQTILLAGLSSLGNVAVESGYGTSVSKYISELRLLTATLLFTRLSDHGVLIRLHLFFMLSQKAK